MEGELEGVQKRYVEWIESRDLMVWFHRLGLGLGSSFVDLGCSRGDWLARISGLGHDVTGVEADERAAQYARRRHGLRIEQTDVSLWSPQPDRYDGVSAFHILEHVLDPRALLRTCHRALRQGGKLLLRVPNVTSWQARVMGRRWKGLEPPRHIVNFSLSAVTSLVRSQGFEIERVSTWSLRDGPPGWSSSLFAWGEPTRQQVRGRIRPWAQWIYAGLTWCLTPLELLAAGLQRGGMTTLIGIKRDLP